MQGKFSHHTVSSECYDQCHFGCLECMAMRIIDFYFLKTRKSKSKSAREKAFFSLFLMFLLNISVKSSTGFLLVN